jgi:hypothetical protein
MENLSKPDDLPSDVLEGAVLRGNEYAWTPESFPVALERAEAHGLACLGGQFQFRLNDATCEMYSKPYALRGSPHQMESAFKKVRLIQWALLAAIPPFAWVAEIGRGSGSSDWTWRHWLAIGLVIWSVSGAFRLRGRLLRSKKLMNNAVTRKLLNSGRQDRSSVWQWRKVLLSGDWQYVWCFTGHCGRPRYSM